jgi:hypothetical protein
MNSEPGYAELIERLIQRTREGKILWVPTAIEDQFVAAVGGNYSLVVERVQDEPEMPAHYQLSIKDLQDREVARIIGDMYGECEQPFYANELAKLLDIIRTGQTLEVASVLKVLDEL